VVVYIIYQNIYSLIKYVISEPTIIRTHIQCLSIDSSTEPDPFGSYIVTDFFCTQPLYYKWVRTCTGRGILLYGIVITAVWI